MNLHTSIPPRRDGTVTLTGLDGKPYVFVRNADGDLACDVAHAPTVAHLLDGGLFYPASDADYAQALRLTASASEDEGGDAGPDGEGDGMPVEANTPPKPARAKPGPKPKTA